ncbi:2-dehydro-3-deoxy-L-rhamnonate dehydrogenase (NAD(+)) [Dyadobacter sp. CECT 9275]|uniref:2-dehydro-3-deoxy-L-rhamnonate dehydrogenase (NAD(+)) n=1 Tax=Dyadobacter helix TaxID=2822344 RepID=A0A916J7X5_9BACT|nr:SDR family NAD(P)-dependent oxidoreductase [Dyadobacter sp. CECT 9275]CAG4989873.1 2-dehydro-3-deoxy-L-rhamnonate dehydrogenase (NAD(+)) [Dyadobacter sp. CECT 9275]
MTDFQGQVAIITGAASGLGLAIAKKLLNEGAKVGLLDYNETALKNEFDHFPDQSESIVLDITRQDLVESAIEQILKRFGRIDILVNCAGITGITNTHSHLVSSENLHKVFELNFMASFYTSKAVLPSMLANNYGRILHIASIAGKEGNAGMLAYSASKAAVIGMTKVQGKEYAENGITVNALAPAVIQTPLVAAMPEAQVKYMTDKIPMKRCGTLEEAANLATYIVSKENSFTTGFTFDLSGGRATY